MSAALNGLHEITAGRSAKLLGEGANEGDLDGDRASLSEQILDRLRSSPGPVSARELRGSIACSAESLSKRLYAMRMDGRVLGAVKHNGASPSVEEDGPRQKYEYSLPTPGVAPPARSLTVGEVSKREASRKPKPDQKGCEASLPPLATEPRSLANAALREGAASLEGVLLELLPEKFHGVLASYGRLCGLIR